MSFLCPNPGGCSLVGESERFVSVVGMARAVGPRQCTVVLNGESGSGKEIIAREIHNASTRNNAPFVVVDCTNLSAELFISQMFGHVKGAFTGADQASLGAIRAADGGTLFLDEVGEMPLAIQARFLRVLQESEVTALGSTQPCPVDIRVVCATHRNLPAMVQEGRFRQDLYYRLDVVSLEIPPLRKRREDIVPLAKYFLKKQADLYSEPVKTLSLEVVDCFLAYSWPGNVRELANVIEAAHALWPKQIIELGALPAHIVSPRGPQKNPILPTLAETERELIMQALKHAQGKKTAAAQLLGIERRRLNRLIDNLNIPVD